MTSARAMLALQWCANDDDGNSEKTEMSTLQLEAVVPFVTQSCCSSRALCAGRENVAMYWVDELHGKSKKDGEYAGEQL